MKTHYDRKREIREERKANSEAAKAAMEALVKEHGWDSVASALGHVASERSKKARTRNSQVAWADRGNAISRTYDYKKTY